MLSIISRCCSSWLVGHLPDEGGPLGRGEVLVVPVDGDAVVVLGHAPEARARRSPRASTPGPGGGGRRTTRGGRPRRSSGESVRSISLSSMPVPSSVRRRRPGPRCPGHRAGPARRGPAISERVPVMIRPPGPVRGAGRRDGHRRGPRGDCRARRRGWYACQTRTSYSADGRGPGPGDRPGPAEDGDHVPGGDPRAAGPAPGAARRTTPSCSPTRSGPGIGEVGEGGELWRQVVRQDRQGRLARHRLAQGVRRARAGPPPTSSSSSTRPAGPAPRSRSSP